MQQKRLAPLPAKHNLIIGLPNKPMLRIDESAAYLNCSNRTVYRYIEQGELTPLLNPHSKGGPHKYLGVLTSSVRDFFLRHLPQQ